MLMTLASDEQALAALKAVGPEVCTTAQAGDFVADAIISGGVGGYISDKVTAQLSDEDPSTIDPAAKANHFKFYPSGTSFQSINHFKQLLMTGEFKKYDFENDEENLKAYGQPSPPHYNINNISGFKIILICGTQDLLASPTDYTWLAQELSKRNNVDFTEYDLGHLGLMMPVDKTNIDYIFDMITRNSNK